MRWHLSHRADPVARVLADRHYSRQTPGATGFVPPGRCLVLITRPTDAFWVTSFPFAELSTYVTLGLERGFAARSGTRARTSPAS